MAEEGTGEKKHGLPDMEDLAEHVKAMIEKLGDESGTNIAASVNVAGEGQTSVSSKQRIVHRDGKTETVTERTEQESS